MKDQCALRRREFEKLTIRFPEYRQADGAGADYLWAQYRPLDTKRLLFLWAPPGGDGFERRMEEIRGGGLGEMFDIVVAECTTGELARSSSSIVSAQAAARIILPAPAGAMDLLGATHAWATGRSDAILHAGTAGSFTPDHPLSMLDILKDGVDFAAFVPPSSRRLVIGGVLAGLLGVSTGVDMRDALSSDRVDNDETALRAMLHRLRRAPKMRSVIMEDEIFSLSPRPRPWQRAQIQLWEWRARRQALEG